MVEGSGLKGFRIPRPGYPSQATYFFSHATKQQDPASTPETSALGKTELRYVLLPNLLPTQPEESPNKAFACILGWGIVRFGRVVLGPGKSAFHFKL